MDGTGDLWWPRPGWRRKKMGGETKPMGESIVFYAAQLNKFVHVKKLRKKGKMKKV